MAKDKITLTVISASREIIKNMEVDEVTLPTNSGENEVLPGHSSLITVLRPGEFRYRLGNKVEKYAISYGLAELIRNNLSILAETIEHATEIDAERAKLAEEKAQEVLLTSLDDTNFKKHSLKLERSLIRQQIGGKK